jgi:O-antigen/teichoic acid export membrane protein
MAGLLGAVVRAKRVPADPLHRSAAALAANTGITSALGFLFWIVAARFYTPAVVGESAALISAMLLLANIAELNLYNALIRFLPTAGERSSRYTLRAYATVTGASVVVGIAALPFLEKYQLVHDLLELGPVGVASILATVLVWTLFALKDSVAIGARASIWVPIGNAVFGIAKLLLLVAVAGAAPQSGVFTAWLVAMVPVLALMNAMIFWRLLPRHAQESAGHAERVTRRSVLAFMTVDNAALIGATAANYLLPVMVAAVAGSEANGYFFVAWGVASALDVALMNVASSLTVEGARRQDRLGSMVAALIRRVLLFAAPLVALVLALAPLILSVYGEAYAAHSTDLLRVVVLAVIPRIVIIVWMSSNRVRQHLGRILSVQALISFTVLGLSWVLLPHYGIVAVGVVHLIVQSVVAAALLPATIRTIRGRVVRSEA